MSRPQLDARTLLADYVGEQCRTVLAAEPALLAALRSASARPPQDPAEGAADSESGGLTAGLTADVAADDVADLDVVELIHDSRVAIRRLRSTLRTFAAAFAEQPAESLAEAASGYADGLGRLRDLDIVEAHIDRTWPEIEPNLVVGEVRVWLAEAIAEERALRRTEALGQVTGEAAAGFRALLAQWAESPSWSGEVDQLKLGRLARKARRRSRRRLNRAVGIALDQPAVGTAKLAADLHRARKATKRARYALEVIAPTRPESSGEDVAHLKAIQDHLGAVQDAVVSRQTLVTVGERIGRRSGRNAFTIGVLAAAAQSAQHDAIADLVRRHS